MLESKYMSLKDELLLKYVLYLLQNVRKKERVQRFPKIHKKIGKAEKLLWEVVLIVEEEKEKANGESNHIVRR